MRIAWQYNLTNLSGIIVSFRIYQLLNKLIEQHFTACLYTEFVILIDTLEIMVLELL